MAMGGANVIPGVSGGTIAFITGVYDKLIHSLKAFDLDAMKLLVRFKFKAFYDHVNLGFLFLLFFGAIISLITVGKALDYLMNLGEVQERYVWSFFFGLILASVYYVGKQIQYWNAPVVISGLIGLCIAVSLAFFEPAQESDSFVYLMICGAVAMSSMLLPGLSGSFVLILMGNYQLIMLEAIPDRDLRIITAVGIGAVIGFVLLSRAIAFLLDRYQNQTISILTGFILGSLLLIWPWKEKVYLMDEKGELLLKGGEPVVASYNWLVPAMNQTLWIAVLLMMAGYSLVGLVEYFGSKNRSK